MITVSATGMIGRQVRAQGVLADRPGVGSAIVSVLAGLRKRQ
jgi:hypothetical protein